ncbi:DUF1987 domain-containing protein [Halocola ammonii]
MDQEPLILEQTEDTPEVRLDPQAGVFCVRGRSLPENSYQFYKDVISWMEQFLASGSKDKVSFLINLDYFNSSSGRYLLELFSILEKSSKNGTDVEIIWEVDSEDELMLEKGEEYRELLSVPVKIQEI